jgi:thioredoxin reductase
MMAKETNGAAMMQPNGDGSTMDKGGMVDYLIIGAGPAGLQLGYFLQKAGHSYVILEAGDSAATFFKKFPRHRTLISSNKVYTGYADPEKNLRWDWNSLLCDNDALLFKNYSKRYFPPADELVRYLKDFAEFYHLKIKYHTRVTKVSKSGGFQVEDQNGHTYCGKRLIIATGFTKPYIPPIPGIELCELYTDVSVRPQDFADKRVLIIGKGNTGFETADNLVETAAIIHLASPHSVKFAWKTHFVGNLRAVNNNVLDTYQLKSQNALLDCTINKIEKCNDGKLKATVSYGHAFGEQEELVYDHVIVCTGWRFDDSIFDMSCKPELAINDRFPRQTSEWESTNVDDLYFAGTLTQQRDYKVTTSGFIHGFRYNIRALTRMFESKYHGGEWPARAIPRCPDAMTRAILDRVNTTSALWQQFGFLGDMFVPGPNGDFLYYEELPADYIHDGPLGQQDDYYILTLEYGKNHDRDLINPVGNYRPHKNDVTNAHFSPGLHPIIRRYNKSQLVEEFHIIEDLYAEWYEDVHIQPLLKFMQRMLAEEPAMAM